MPSYRAVFSRFLTRRDFEEVQFQLSLNMLVIDNRVVEETPVRVTADVGKEGKKRVNRVDRSRR